MHAKKGFTLVELIVVITIVAILGTIAFLSFFGYTKTARDSSRISNLQSIEKVFSIRREKGYRLLLPDDKVDIQAGGYTFMYTGFAGNNIFRAGEFVTSGDEILKDPQTKESYPYVADSRQTGFIVSGFLENYSDTSENKSDLPNGVTVDGYEGKVPYILGDNLGVIIKDNELIQKNATYLTAGFFELKNSNETFTVLHSNDTNLTGTGKAIFSRIYNMEPKLLQDKNLAIYDDYLEGYWDMDTNIYTGGFNQIKDFSQNANHAQCQLAGVQVDCTTDIRVPYTQFLSIRPGRAMMFTGNNRLYVPHNANLDLGSGNFTFTTSVRSNFNANNQGIANKGATPFNLNGTGFELRSQSNTILEACLWGGSGTCPTINYQGGLIRDVFGNGYFGSIFIISNRTTPTISIEAAGDGTTGLTTGSFGPTYTDSYPLYFGWGNGGYFYGSIDEARIYSRVLTEAERRAIERAQLTK